MLPVGARRVLALVVLLATVAMAAVMAFYGWETFHTAWSRNWKSETVWAFPLWIPYLAMPLGFVLFLVQLIADLWLVVSGRDAVLAASAHGVEIEELAD